MTNTMDMVETLAA